MQQTEAIVTWHGAKWREYEQPVVAMSSTDAPYIAGRMTRRVFGVLDCHTLSRQQIALRADLSVKQVERGLDALIRRGIVERVNVSSGSRQSTGDVRTLYRRVA